MKRDRRAFTLIEVVLALALGSMLMIALVGVLRSTSNQLLQIRPAGETNCEAAFRVLARDLLLAQTISHADDGWLELTGSFPVFGNSEMFASGVAYAVVAAPNVSGAVLMRVSEHGGQAIAPNIASIVVERLDSAGTPQPLSARQATLAGAVRVWIWESGSDQPVLQRDVVIH